jgi:hypothetical protein
MAFVSRFAILCLLLLGLFGCSNRATLWLLDVSALESSTAEPGSTLELSGRAFPPGRSGELLLIGQLRAPGESPKRVTYTLRALAASSTRATAYVDDRTAESAGPHATFEGRAQLRFAQDHGPWVAGEVRDVVLEWIGNEDATDSGLRSEGQRVAASLGLDLVEPATETGTVRVAGVHEGSAADAARIVIGEQVVMASGLHVRSLADLAQPSAARSVRLVLRDAVDVQRTLELELPRSSSAMLEGHRYLFWVCPVLVALAFFGPWVAPSELLRAALARVRRERFAVFRAFGGANFAGTAVREDPGGSASQIAPTSPANIAGRGGAVSTSPRIAPESPATIAARNSAGSSTSHIVLKSIVPRMSKSLAAIALWTGIGAAVSCLAAWSGSGLTLWAALAVYVALVVLRMWRLVPTPGTSEILDPHERRAEVLRQKFAFLGRGLLVSAMLGSSGVLAGSSSLAMLASEQGAAPWGWSIFARVPTWLAAAILVSRASKLHGVAGADAAEVVLDNLGRIILGVGITTVWFGGGATGELGLWPAVDLGLSSAVFAVKLFAVLCVLAFVQPFATATRLQLRRWCAAYFVVCLAWAWIAPERAVESRIGTAVLISLLLTCVLAAIEYLSQRRVTDPARSIEA